VLLCQEDVAVFEGRNDGFGVGGRPRCVDDTVASRAVVGGGLRPRAAVIGKLHPDLMVAGRDAVVGADVSDRRRNLSVFFDTIGPH
jgi:hypothetical protein